VYRIAIVEDDCEFIEEIQNYLSQFGEEQGHRFEVTVFHDGAELVEGYQPKYDLILLDVEMPRMNGMDAAERIRETDENVVIMFITNMAQYAIRGYSVGALDFVMKPINYYTFSMKMKRALKRVVKKEIPTILLTLPDGVKKLEVRQIYYVEVQNRIVKYYTTHGVIVMRGTLQAAEESLPSSIFARCNYWYLVNLMHVTEVRKNIAVVGPFSLEISRRNRPAFLKALAEYMGGNS